MAFRVKEVCVIRLEKKSVFQQQKNSPFLQEVNRNDDFVEHIGELNLSVRPTSLAVHRCDERNEHLTGIHRFVKAILPIVAYENKKKMENHD